MSPKPVFFPSPRAFRAWLETNGAKAAELLVGYHKTSTGRPSMTWSQSVDEALCFGWIDGIRRSLGAEAYVIRFTPRRKGSSWSAINLAKVKALEAAGRMTAAGLAAYAARPAGDAGYSYERKTARLAPRDLSFLKRDRAAWAFFLSLPPGRVRLIAHWVTSARKPETRARRLEGLRAACAAGRRLF